MSNCDAIHSTNDVTRYDVSPNDLDDLVFYSFRYALGRKTYAVSIVVDLITKYWEEISHRSKTSIQKEIKESIERNTAGHECDVFEWQKILILKV